MAIRVFRTLVCVDGVCVADDPKASVKGRRGVVLETLTSMNENASKDARPHATALRSYLPAALPPTLPVALERALAAQPGRFAWSIADHPTIEARGHPVRTLR